MRPRSTLAVTLVAVAVLGTGLTPALATSHFEITSEDSNPTPERSFEFRDTTYRLDSVVLASPGEGVNVSVGGPGETYRVYVYNGEEQVVDSRRAEGNGTFTFDLVGYEPGSYAVTVYQDGDYEAVEPLVVTGYDVSIDAPERVGTDENASVRVDVERTGADSSPHVVSVVVASSEDELVVNATGSDGDYTADIEPGTLDDDNGTYAVYGLVRGDTRAFGRNEVLGVSDRVPLSVRNATATPTVEPTVTTTSGTEPTPTPTPTVTATPSDATPTDAPGTDTTGTDATDTDESAITPNEDRRPETTTGTGPGFSGYLTVLAAALAVAAALLGRRG